jgi:hypothetical protein
LDGFKTRFTVIEYNLISFGFLPYYAKPLIGTYKLTADPDLRTTDPNYNTDATISIDDVTTHCYTISMPGSTEGCLAVNKIELAINSYDNDCRGSIAGFQYTPLSGNKVDIPYSLTWANVGGVNKVVAIKGSVPNDQSFADRGKICIVWNKDKYSKSLRKACKPMIAPLGETTQNFVFVSRTSDFRGWCGVGAQLEI